MQAKPLALMSPELVGACQPARFIRPNTSQARDASHPPDNDPKPGSPTATSKIDGCQDTKIPRKAPRH